jgi:GDSL-like Lipase/Acylhydrolase family
MITHSRAVLTERIKTAAAVDRTMDAFRKFVSGYALIISLLIAPPIFERFFAMLYLFQGERVILWIASVLLMSISLYGFFGRLRPTWVYFVLFNLLVLISVELGARSAVKLFFPNKEVSLALRAAWTYDELRKMTGHPFLQFNGIPSTTGNQMLGWYFSNFNSRQLEGADSFKASTGNLDIFNNFGFVGRDFAYAKPPGVIRIAALGASTTADGYPAMLEEYLNARVAAQSNRFEVMNFGHAFYTSAHVLVNFVLNVIDFAPDYVIIHQAANDEHARASEAEFRGDYSHYLKVFQPPRIWDRYILRVSVPYRALKFYLDPSPEWMFVEAASQTRRKELQRPLNARELGVFRRNIETIIDVASARQIKVVLTTMPHSTDERYGHLHLHHIDQFNEVLRSIAANHDRLLFVDLDKLMTGKDNHLFLDVVHVNDTGRRMKVEYLGKRIIDDEERTLLKAP